MAAILNFRSIAMVIVLGTIRTLTASDAPSAVITVSNAEVAAPAAVAFDGSASGPNARAFAWDFGDGSNGSGFATTHTYAAAGTFTATLVVTSDDGVASAPASTKIVVNDTAAPLPVTSFTGHYGKPGKVSAKLELNLPAGTNLGSTATVAVGGQKWTFTMIGQKGLAKKGSQFSVSGTDVKFKLLGTAKTIFGSALKTGSKTVAITVNGIAYTSTVNFSTTGMLTSFH